VQRLEAYQGGSQRLAVASAARTRRSANRDHGAIKYLGMALTARFDCAHRRQRPPAWIDCWRAKPDRFLGKNDRSSFFDFSRSPCSVRRMAYVMLSLGLLNHGQGDVSFKPHRPDAVGRQPPVSNRLLRPLLREHPRKAISAVFSCDCRRFTRNSHPFAARQKQPGCLCP